MSGTTDKGIGWLPVEARDRLEEESGKASAVRAQALLALDPRARVLALLDHAACRDAEEQAERALSAADLKRVLESFPGAAPVEEAALAERLPALLPARPV